jgi:hypothetical protein
MNAYSLSGCALAIAILTPYGASAEIPAAIAAPGVPIATLHAQGIQLYQCNADASGNRVWEFREPVAALLKDGNTVGLHYAGPSWELADGSVVTGKIAGRAPGATPKDIPLFKLEIASRRGIGGFAKVTTIQRLNTKGGTADGPCPEAGSLLSVPYSADYRFFE